MPDDHKTNDFHEQEQASTTHLVKIPLRVFNPSDPIPPRRPLIYGGLMARKKLTVWGGAGGTLKSTMLLTIAASLACGRQLLGINPETTHRVTYISTEDEQEELERVLHGVSKVHDISKHELEDRLNAIGTDCLPEHFALCANDESGKPHLHEPDFRHIQDVIDAHKDDVLIMDPLAGLTGGIELRPEIMNMIARRFAKLARTNEISTNLCHHARKKVAGSAKIDTDDLTGGKPLSDASRSVVMIERIGKPELEEISQPESALGKIVCARVTKTNLIPHGRKFYYEAKSTMLEPTEGGAYEIQAIAKITPIYKNGEINEDVWIGVKLVLAAEFVLYAPKARVHETYKRLEDVVQIIVTEMNLPIDAAKMTAKLRDTKRVVMINEKPPGGKKTVQRAVSGEIPPLKPKNPPHTEPENSAGFDPEDCPF